MAWKLHGRVGDSPIIGAGLYADNEVGAATASGVGEEMIRNAASFLVVELMRQGRSPTEACREAITGLTIRHRGSPYCASRRSSRIAGSVGTSWMLLHERAQP